MEWLRKEGSGKDIRTEIRKIVEARRNDTGSKQKEEEER